MKHFYFIISILLLSANIFAQQAFVNQGFEEGLPSNWTVYNEDGDDNEWEIINQSFWAMTGNKAISLQTTTEANDWLVSSQIFLQETYILTFWATEIVEGSEENITVWLSTTGNATTDFTVNLSDITVPYLGYDDDGYLYTEYIIDLSAYQGQNVYIAWQLTSPENDGLCLIDNIVTQYTAENIEWSMVTSGFWNNSIYSVSDGGYIVTGGYNGDLSLQKLTSEGAIEWTTLTNGNTVGDLGYSVVETFDENDELSGFIVTGQRSMPGNFSMLIWVCKYDINGTLEWENDFGINGTQNEGTSVKQANDGGYIITGYEGLNNSQIILIKLNENGDEEWIRSFGNSDIDYASEVIQTADGGFAITGFYKKNPGDNGTIFILKTDIDGFEEFWEEYPDTDFARADGICQTSEGGFILAAYNHENVKDWRIIKTDKRGIVEWEYTDGGPEADEPRSIQQTAEGNYIIAGKKLVNENERMWIVKLDNEGELLWETEYETTEGQSRITEIHQTHDGGYIFTALSDVFSESVDGFIAKIEQDETEVSQNDIISFYLPEQTEDAIIDTDNHTITITVADQTNITELVPVIFASPQARIFPRSATRQNFSENFIYTITALDQTPQEWTIIVEGGTTEINQFDNNYTIYPNPSNGVFTINYDDTRSYRRLQVKITDITGKTIFSKEVACNISTSKIDLSNQPKGIYFLTINSKTDIYTEKIIIK